MDPPRGPNKQQGALHYKRIVKRHSQTHRAQPEAAQPPPPPPPSPPPPSPPPPSPPRPPSSSSVPHSDSFSGFPRPGTTDSDGRTYIVPEGDNFDPSKPVVSRITEIIRSRYDTPYLTWHGIPQATRDIWFGEFRRFFYWAPEHEHRVRRSFEARGRHRLSDMFTAARRKDQRPSWIGEGVWAELQRQWGSAEYVQRRDINKRNRTTEAAQAAAVHFGGSRPTTEHHRQLETFEKRREEASTSAGSGSQASDARSDFALWKDVVGKKKGGSFRLGSKGIAVEAELSGASASRTATTDSSTEHSELVERLAVMAAEREADRADIRQLREEITRLTAEVRRRGKRPMPPVDDEEAMEDTDTDTE